MLALLGLAVVVGGAGVVVFAATWLWTPGVGMPVLVGEEAVDGAAEEAVVVVGISVVEGVVVGAVVEDVVVVSGAFVVVSTTGEAVVEASFSDTKPVVFRSSVVWGAAVVVGSSSARTTLE